MSSMFETDVNNRKSHTPWASVSLTRFAKEMAENGHYADSEIARQSGVNPQNYYTGRNDFVLIIESRPDVQSRFWYTVKWTGADGKRHQQSAQYMDLCLWRASQEELNVEKRISAQEDALEER